MSNRATSHPDSRPTRWPDSFTCPDGKQFVGYLERYNSKAKAILDQVTSARASGGTLPNIGEVQSAAMNGIELKKPADKDWTSGVGPASVNMRRVLCPDGSAAAPVMAR